MLRSPIASSPRRRPSGWSIVEILVATGLVLALLAIGIPVATRVFERGELSATEENVASELLKARAEAQKSGRPVEVLIDRDPGRIIQRYFAPGAGVGIAREGAPKRTRGSDDAPWRRESSIDPAVTVETTKRAASKSEPERGGAGGPTRIAVFMPDGSILFAAAVILMHESGMRSQVSLDPYTGHPAVERGVADAAATDDDADDADEAQDDAERKPVQPRGAGSPNDPFRFERAP